MKSHIVYMVPKWIVVSLDQCQQANCVRPVGSVLPALCCDIIISLCAKLHKNVERTTSFLCVLLRIYVGLSALLSRKKVKCINKYNFTGWLSKYPVTILGLICV